jgi:hypothetical protein
LPSQKAEPIMAFTPPLLKSATLRKRGPQPLVPQFPGAKNVGFAGTAPAPKLSDPVAPSVLRQLFLIFSNAVAEMLGHAPHALSYEEGLATALSECVRDFELFFPQLQRIARTYLAHALPKAATNERGQNAGACFVSSWYILSYSLLEIRKSGIAPIMAIISGSFDKVFASLRSITAEDVHDPVGIAVSALTRQTQAARRSLLFRLKHADGSRDDGAMKSELKNLHALINEFTHSPLPQDMVRVTVLSEVNDIIIASRAAFLFIPDLATITTTFEDFRLAFAQHAERIGIPMSQIPVELRRQEDGKRDEPDVDQRMDLMEMLDVSLELISRLTGQSSRVNRLFASLKQKAIDLEIVSRDTMKQNVALNGKLTELRQEIEQSQSLIQLKELYSEAHGFATGERPAEFPSDEKQLICSIRQTVQLLEQQRVGLTETIEKTRAILPSALPGADLIAVAEAVRSSVMQTEQEIKVQRQRLAKIMESLGVPKSSIGDNDIQLAIKKLKEASIEHDVRRTIAARFDISAELTLVDQLNFLVNERECQRKEIENLRYLMREVHIGLAKCVTGGLPAVNVPDSQGIRELIPMLRDFVPLIEIDSKLREALKMESMPSNDYHGRVASLLSIVKELVGLAQKNKKGPMALFESRATIEIIARKLKRHLGDESVIDFSGVDLNAIISEIADLCDRLDRHISSSAKRRISCLFTKVFPLFEASSTSEPMYFIPEFCQQFTTLVLSVQALEPFSKVLADINNQFDCRLASFKPGSQSFTFIRDKIYALNTLLNEVSLADAVPIIRTVVSFFIGLLTSFLGALTAESAELER